MPAAPRRSGMSSSAGIPAGPAEFRCRIRPRCRGASGSTARRSSFTPAARERAEKSPRPETPGSPGRVDRRNAGRHAGPVDPLQTMAQVRPNIPASARPARLFRDGRNQAVRIPREFELPADEAMICREDGRLIVVPVERSPTLAEELSRLAPIEEDFPDMAIRCPGPKSFSDAPQPQYIPDTNIASDLVHEPGGLAKRRGQSLPGDLRRASRPARSRPLQTGPTQSLQRTPQPGGGRSPRAAGRSRRARGNRQGHDRAGRPLATGPRLKGPGDGRNTARGRPSGRADPRGQRQSPSTARRRSGRVRQSPP